MVANREIAYQDMRSNLTDITWTANAYTSVAADLKKVLSGTTGATTRTLTLLSAATAGAGAVQSVIKADNGIGSFNVTDGTNTWSLRTPGKVAIFVSTGSSWLTDFVAPIPTMYEAGKFYSSLPGVAWGASTVTKDIIYTYPFTISAPMTLDAMCAFQQGAATGTVDMKFAIYGPSTANPGKPDGAALLSPANIAVATLSTGGSGVVSSATGLAISLKPNVYWIASKMGNTGTVPNMSVTGFPITHITGTADGTKTLSTSSARLIGYSAADAIANSFPTTFPASADVTTAIIPAIAIKAI